MSNYDIREQVENLVLEALDNKVAPVEIVGWLYFAINTLAETERQITRGKK